MHQQNVRLSTISDFTQHSDTLTSKGINTAEDFVALASAPGGIQALTDILSVPEDGVRHLVDRAKQVLPVSKVAQLEAPIDLERFATGAILPPANPNSSPST